MKLTRTIATTFALFAVSLTATPAAAATRPRPVTLDVLRSGCVGPNWTITFKVSTTAPRTVDLYDDSDYGPRLIVDTAGVAQSAVAVNGSVTVTYRPGPMAQYVQIGVFPAGTGGWDGQADPLAAKTVYDPAQYNLYAGC